MKLVNYHDGGFYHADCLDAMKRLPAGCVDMILADLPYGTTQNKWDVVIPFEPLWAEYWRVLKDNGAVVLTAAQPFTSTLVVSQLNAFKYGLVWDKVNKYTDALNAKRRPMRRHEDICVFYRKQPTYNPQKQPCAPWKSRRSKNTKTKSYGEVKAPVDYGALITEINPCTVIAIEGAATTGINHPTQKPVELFEYLIKTYSNPGDIILDNTAGSGTTAIAARNTGRRWICIESDETYFEKAVERVSLNPPPVP